MLAWPKRPKSTCFQTVGIADHPIELPLRLPLLLILSAIESDGFGIIANVHQTVSSLVAGATSGGSGAGEPSRE